MPGWHGRTKLLVKDGKLALAAPTFMTVVPTIIPHTKTPNAAVRVFPEAIPQKDRLVKWNDEAGLSTVHIKVPQGWTAHPAALILAPNDQGQDQLDAPRRLEFELRHDRNSKPASLTPAASVEVFSQVCSGADNTCSFVRSEIEIPLGP